MAFQVGSKLVSKLFSMALKYVSCLTHTKHILNQIVNIFLRGKWDDSDFDSVHREIAFEVESSRALDLFAATEMPILIKIA